MNDKNKRVKEGCSECSEDKNKESSMDERRERVEKVMDLLRDVHYKTEQEKDAAVISFVKSSMSISEIEFIASTLRPDYTKSKEAQVNRKGVF